MELKTARISFQMEEDLKNKAFEKAKKENVNLSALIRSWLIEWTSNQSKNIVNK